LHFAKSVSRILDADDSSLTEQSRKRRNNGVASCVIPEEAKVVVLVAHPDDETLWAGGTLLTHGGWTIVVGTLCRAGDADRAPKFFRALDRLGAKGTMADLDDGPAQTPLTDEVVSSTLRSLVPKELFDLILTHAPHGEYTRHLRHEEVGRSVLKLWACGEIQSREVWLFAYEDSDGSHLPRAEHDADVLVELSDEIWGVKRALLTDTYGFGPDSWEARTNPRKEGFWRLVAPDDARAWLERRDLHP
jgi:LmbE family N-acetylglucosaminyl deacetylase